MTDENDAAQLAALAEWESARLREARVVVDVRTAPKEATGEELADDAYKQPTAMVDSDDAEIRGLATRTLAAAGLTNGGLLARARCGDTVSFCGP